MFYWNNVSKSQTTISGVSDKVINNIIIVATRIMVQLHIMNIKYTYNYYG
jgi:hypothetical protein